MILSGKEIEREVKNGNIVINPFNPSQVNPNSYNLTLHNELLVYEDDILDMRKPNPTKKLIIPKEGLLLEPNKLYLGRTKEFTTTSKYVPMLEGRSSTGRLGLCIHITAGFGDIGFAGYWKMCIRDRWQTVPIRCSPVTLFGISHKVSWEMVRALERLLQ